jgi:predicted esterase
MTSINNSGLFDGIISFGPPGFDGFRGPSRDGTSRPRGSSWFTGNTLAAGSGVRVLLVHGREDPHAPFAVSEHARDTLKDAGYDVTFRPFVGGHTVPKDQLGFVGKWIRKGNP